MALATISRVRPLFRSWALRRPTLRNPDPIINRAVFISGVKGVTQNVIFDALQAETGERFTVEHVDMKKIKKEAEEALERSELAKAVKGMTINSNFNEEDGMANFWDMVENDWLGVNLASVREAVKDAMEKLGKDEGVE